MRRRRGFAKLAIKHNALMLLPTFSFGETQTMDNLYLPKIQTYTKKRLGFPIPYWPYGRMGLPIPRRKKITLAVGAPVYPVRFDVTTEEEDERLVDRYFDSLERLFEEKKAECGFSDSYINCPIKEHHFYLASTTCCIIIFTTKNDSQGNKLFFQKYRLPLFYPVDSELVDLDDFPLYTMLRDSYSSTARLHSANEL